MVATLAADFIDGYRRRFFSTAFSFKDVVYRLFAFVVTASLILWLSVFLYVSFYYSYVPVISYTRPVHFDFKSCKDEAGVCSFPAANISLANEGQVLLGGQPYNLIVEMDLPESDANKRLGMFVVQMLLTGKDGSLVGASRRISMLRYKSLALHLISTFFYSPFLLTGPMEEKQTLKIEMFSKFFANKANPVTNIYIEVESRWLEMYSANVRIHADFTGLRHFMFYWPVLSSAIGITSNIVILSLLVMYIWFRLKPNQVVVRVDMPIKRNSTLSGTAVLRSASLESGAIDPDDQCSSEKTIEQRREEAKQKLAQEKSRRFRAWASTSGLQTESSLERVEELNYQRSATPTTPPPYDQLALSGGARQGQESEGLEMHELPRRADSTVRQRSPAVAEMSLSS